MFYDFPKTFGMLVIIIIMLINCIFIFQPYGYNQNIERKPPAYPGQQQSTVVWPQRGPVQIPQPTVTQQGKPQQQPPQQHASFVKSEHQQSQQPGYSGSQPQQQTYPTGYYRPGEQPQGRPSAPWERQPGPNYVRPSYQAQQPQQGAPPGYPGARLPGDWSERAINETNANSANQDWAQRQAQQRAYGPDYAQQQAKAGQFNGKS